MLNYLRSEIYRNLRSKGNYLFILGAMAFVVFLNGVLWMFGNTDVSFSYNKKKKVLKNKIHHTKQELPLLLYLYTDFAPWLFFSFQVLKTLLFRLFIYSAMNNYYEIISLQKFTLIIK